MAHMVGPLQDETGNSRTPNAIRSALYSGTACLPPDEGSGLLTGKRWHSLQRGHDSPLCGVQPAGQMRIELPTRRAVRYGGPYAPVEEKHPAGKARQTTGRSTPIVCAKGKSVVVVRFPPPRRAKGAHTIPQCRMTDQRPPTGSHRLCGWIGLGGRHAKRDGGVGHQASASRSDVASVRRTSHPLRCPSDPSLEMGALGPRQADRPRRALKFAPMIVITCGVWCESATPGAVLTRVGAIYIARGGGIGAGGQARGPLPRSAL